LGGTGIVTYGGGGSLALGTGVSRGEISGSVQASGVTGLGGAHGTQGTDVGG
jgi:hypothetical protein